MIKSRPKEKSPKKVVVMQEVDTRLSGRWLILARAIWLLLVACAFVLLVVSLPQYSTYFAQLQQPCLGKTCGGSVGQLSPDALRTLAGFHINPLIYAIFVTATYSFIPAVVWILIGGILVWRKSDDWMALLVSLLLILWSENFATIFGVLVPATPSWQSLYALLNNLSAMLIGLVFCLFPSGRFAPRWLILIALAWVLNFSISGLLPSISWFTSGPIFVLLLAIILGSQIYRYVRVSTPLQRQQTKWLLYGLSITFLVSDFGYPILSQFFPVLAQPGSLDNSILGGCLWAILFLCIPLSIGIAMLRYRLWDIDILINRTLVYGSLTALLVLIYLGCVIGLEALLHNFTQSSDLAIVGSTLAIAALFQPLRRSLQRLIDRRFYRSKYDAARTLADFSTTLRNEVDLNQLSEHLVAVIEETMQPTHVSLWLRKPTRKWLQAEGSST